MFRKGSWWFGVPTDVLACLSSCIYQTILEPTGMHFLVHMRHALMRWLQVLTIIDRFQEGEPGSDTRTKGTPGRKSCLQAQLDIMWNIFFKGIWFLLSPTRGVGPFCRGFWVRKFEWTFPASIVDFFAELLSVRCAPSVKELRHAKKQRPKHSG